MAGNKKRLTIIKQKRKEEVETNLVWTKYKTEAEESNKVTNAHAFNSSYTISRQIYPFPMIS